MSGRERRQEACLMDNLQRSKGAEFSMIMELARGSSAKAWLRAIELTAQIDSDPHHLFADVVELAASKAIY